MKTTQNIAKMALHVKKGNDAIFRLTCKNQKSLFCFFLLANKGKNSTKL
jgi:hypothetical protein